MLLYRFEIADDVADLDCVELEFRHLRHAVMADEDALASASSRPRQGSAADLAESDRLRERGSCRSSPTAWQGGAIWASKNGAPGGGIRQRAGLRLGEDDEHAADDTGL